MNGYIVDIEKETLDNSDYRRVLFTSEFSQLVVMSLLVGEEIGMEVHKLDQFIRVEKGEALVVLDGVESKLGEDFAVVIPAGVEHNVVNVGEGKLKLYTIYSPPEHAPGIVHAVKADDHEH